MPKIPIAKTIIPPKNKISKAIVVKPGTLISSAKYLNNKYN